MIQCALDNYTFAVNTARSHRYPMGLFFPRSKRKISVRWLARMALADVNVTSSHTSYMHMQDKLHSNSAI